MTRWTMFSTEAEVTAHNLNVRSARVVKGKSSVDAEKRAIPKPEKPPKVRVPRKARTWGYEERLERDLALLGIKGEREYRWLEGRKYRADLGFKRERLIVEIEGEAHRIKGRFHDDIRKSQDAVLNGWRLLRLSTGQVRDGTAAFIVKRALGASVMIGEYPANDIPFHGGPK